MSTRASSSRTTRSNGSGGGVGIGSGGADERREDGEQHEDDWEGQSVDDDDLDEPVKKKARKTTKSKGKGKGKVSKKIEGTLAPLLDMPVEIFTEIAGHLDPVTLLYMSRASKAFHQLFASRSTSSKAVWQAARATVDLPDLEADDHTEMAYAAFMFDKVCWICGNDRGTVLNLDLRKRYCKECFKEDLVLTSSIYYDHKDLKLHSRINVCLLATDKRPNSNKPGKETFTSLALLRPLNAQLKSLQDASGVPDDVASDNPMEQLFGEIMRGDTYKPEEAELQAFVEERRKFQTAVKADAKVLEHWMKETSAGRRKELDKIRTERREHISTLEDCSDYFAAGRRVGASVDLGSAAKAVMSPDNTGSPIAGFRKQEAKGKALPCFNVKEDGLMRISPETLNQLQSGHYREGLKEFVVIDCRFDYEYDGGHIDGAINLSEHADLEARLLNIPNPPVPSTSEYAPRDGKMILIFHCEFSAKRAPTCAKYVRNQDRLKNFAAYPNIHYPEVYVLQGGYEAYYKAFPERCVGGYVVMDHPEHDAKRSININKFREQKRQFNRATFQLSSSNIRHLVVQTRALTETIWNRISVDILAHVEANRNARLDRERAAREAAAQDLLRPYYNSMLAAQVAVGEAASLPPLAEFIHLPALAQFWLDDPPAKLDNEAWAAAGPTILHEVKVEVEGLEAAEDVD
ncbi:hypothetical protein JCM6882_002652 [Rhodosporidiobolus microsporus]